MKEYPKGQRAMLTMYAQGYALADFLVQQKGRQAYLDFIGKGELIGWDQAIQQHFDHEGIQKLERNWRGWILAGMPKLTVPREEMLTAAAQVQTQSQEAAHPVLPSVRPVSNSPARRSKAPQQNVIRSQSPSGSADVFKNVRSTNAESVNDSAGRRTVAEPPVQRDYRHSSIIAPTPQGVLKDTIMESSRGEDHEQASTGQEDASEKEPDRFFSESGENSKGSSVTNSSTDPMPRSESPASSRVQFEATGVHFEKSVAAEDGVTGFQFDGVLLPRERKEGPASTPQWAGFPGQKKLF